MVLLNWSAPSTVSSNGTQLQADLASCLIHQSQQNVGLLLSPMFAYDKGGIWPAEMASIYMLVNKSLVLETSWSLIFAEQRDKRDSRPLQYKGRIIEGPTAPAQCWWWNTKIARGYTDAATQMNAKDMVLWEDVMTDALPMSVDDSAVTVQGAAKYQQIG